MVRLYNCLINSKVSGREVNARKKSAVDAGGAIGLETVAVEFDSDSMSVCREGVYRRLALKTGCGWRPFSMRLGRWSPVVGMPEEASCSRPRYGLILKDSGCSERIRSSDMYMLQRGLVCRALQ